MARKRERNTGQDKFARMGELLRKDYPQFYSWSEDIESFRELRIKLQGDGSMLGIAKGYASDGSPVVCFGSGYGVAGAFLAIEGTIAGNYWRKDKPWKP